MLREATTADAAEIAANEARAAHAPWTTDAVRGTLVSPLARAWVVTERGEVVGHLLSTVVLDEAELLTLGVAPSARRRGLARALLAAAAEGWRDVGVRTAWLEVRVDNAGATALYASTGWTREGVRRAYYSDGMDAALWRLNLAAVSLSSS